MQFQIIVVVVVAALVTALVYLVSALNHPFSGVYRVEPSAFKILLGRFNASP